MTNRRKPVIGILGLTRRTDPGLYVSGEHVFTGSTNVRAVQMNGGVPVLVPAAAVAVIICVGYLCLQAEIVNRSERVASLQEELADLNEQNTTAYNAAESSVNLEAVWERATGEMGMVYAAEGNLVEYESPEEDSVVQFGDIPANGIVVQK